MRIIFSLWASILHLWIQIGTPIFPPVIHPMLVHFPIVLLYGSVLTGLLGLLWRTPDRFFDRSSFWLLVLGLIAGIVASAAGVISEQFVKWTPTTIALLSAHQTYAVLTGLFTILALISRIIARYPRTSQSRRAWSLASTGRGRQTLLSMIFSIAAVVMITMGASLGGTMVYQYGVGIHGVSYHTPAWLSHHQP
ncbi:MAG: hypothetical protein C7B45_16280 [Sulfobacillus acidophilus]|uniref:DUF2231 domain-containing protein n=1 Tax=Sulfobacillus acidophilus TaxID=53633 RepID=A0A2T2WD47_9FIRM|nr:MAG: hypothetical protein C7B45_16280 [Sulfobacillus acidophilus]